MRDSHMATWLVAIVLCACTIANLREAESATSVGFYATSCPNAETIVHQQVQTRFNADPTIPGGILRIAFHDCFVQGCDASVLIDSTPGNTAEKDAGPNLSLRDLDLIDTIKTALEAVCPGVVSCADIIQLAARDCIGLAGGPSYAAKTGRFDGLTSLEADANILPSPADSVSQAQAAFASQGLSLNQMVTLLGAHTTGFAECDFFSDRLYDFQGTGQPDPTMNPTLVTRLKGVCPDPASGNPADPAVALDQGTQNAFDSSYYSQLGLHNGILQIDQELAGDASTSGLVSQFTNQAVFFPAFVNAILVLGDLGVKTAANGQIRINCHAVNPVGAPPPPVRSPPPPALSPPPPVQSPPPPVHSPPPPITPIQSPAPPPTPIHSPPPPPVTPVQSPPPPVTPVHSPPPPPVPAVHSPPPPVTPVASPPPPAVATPKPPPPAVATPTPTAHSPPPPPVATPKPPPPPVATPAPTAQSPPPPVVTPAPTAQSPPPPANTTPPSATSTPVPIPPVTSHPLPRSKPPPPPPFFKPPKTPKQPPRLPLPLPLPPVRLPPRLPLPPVRLPPRRPLPPKRPPPLRRPPLLPPVRRQSSKPRRPPVFKNPFHH